MTRLPWQTLAKWQLNSLVQEIRDWCIQQNIFLSTAHIPGVEKEAADSESRKPLKDTEWALDKTIYQLGIRLLDVNPVIDLFAFQLKYKVKLFIAYQPDSEAQAVIHLKFPGNHISYAFLPFSIIPLVLQKI